MSILGPSLAASHHAGKQWWGDTGECPVLLAGPGVGWRSRSALTRAWHSRQGLARDLPNLFLVFGRIRTAAHLFLLTLI